MVLGYGLGGGMAWNLERYDLNKGEGRWAYELYSVENEYLSS